MCLNLFCSHMCFTAWTYGSTVVRLIVHLCPVQNNEASEVLACAHATWALLHAQQLRQSSTAASPSKSAASPRQEWLRCFEHVRKALQLWQQSSQDGGETQDATHTDEAGALWDASACLELMLELLVLAGLHGEPAVLHH